MRVPPAVSVVVPGSEAGARVGGGVGEGVDVAVGNGDGVSVGVEVAVGRGVGVGDGVFEGEGDGSSPPIVIVTTGTLVSCCGGSWCTSVIGRTNTHRAIITARINTPVPYRNQ